MPTNFPDQMRRAVETGVPLDSVVRSLDPVTARSDWLEVGAPVCHTLHKVPFPQLYKSQFGLKKKFLHS